MEAQPSPAAVFLAALERPERAAASRERLEQVLHGMIAAAQAAWPEVRQPTDRFLAYVAARVPDEGDLEEALDAMRSVELYLTCACAAGDTAALAAFEARYTPGIEVALARLKLGRSVIDEVTQTLRRQLFVGKAPASPRITAYDGRGDLASWLRVTAVRQALKHLRREQREVAVEEEQLLAVPTPEEDAELSYLKHTYRAAFKVAFREALGTLSPREQLLLRQQVLDGLNIDELGALYGVHRATAARWLAGARATLLKQTRGCLMQRIHVDSTECDSIIRLVRSHLDLTFSTLIRRQ